MENTSSFIIFAAGIGIFGILIGFIIGWLSGKVSSQKRLSNQLMPNEQQMRQIIEGISAKSLQDNSNSYLQQTDIHLKNILNPLTQGMNKLEQQIQFVERGRIEAYKGVNQTVAQLSNEIQGLQHSNAELKTTAQNLDQALRSNHSTRGKWGEIQLRRIAEITGMQEHIDFNEQVNFSKDGVSLRPDMIINLPKNGYIPVDAKAPMNAYLNACNANNPEEAKTYLAQHKQALEGHIKTLSKKEYWKQDGNLESAQLVVMFVPYESGVEASLSFDPELLDKALNSNVVIAGPTTLYALLKVISYGWMQVALTKNTEEIYKISKDLFARFSTFYDHYTKIGQSLNSAVGSFNKASGSLSSRFLPTLKQIHTLSASNEKLPEQDDINSIDIHAREYTEENISSNKHAFSERKSQTLDIL